MKKRKQIETRREFAQHIIGDVQITITEIIRGNGDQEPTRHNFDIEVAAIDGTPAAPEKAMDAIWDIAPAYWEAGQAELNRLCKEAIAAGTDDAPRTTKAEAVFDALSFYAADLTDWENCAADIQRDWAQEVGANPGEEPEPGQWGRFTVEYDGQSIEVDYKPHHIGTVDHFSIQSLDNAPHRLSETGYRSDFAERIEIIACGGPAAFIRRMFDAAKPVAQQPAIVQLSLF